MVAVAWPDGAGVVDYSDCRRARVLLCTLGYRGACSPLTWRGQEAVDQAESVERARGDSADWPCRTGNHPNKQARKGRRAEADIDVLESFNTGCV